MYINYVYTVKCVLTQNAPKRVWRARLVLTRYTAPGLVEGQRVMYTELCN